MEKKKRSTTAQKAPVAERNNTNEFKLFVSKLENMILTGFFKPRERLVEAALSEMFGVSRYSVRDAFKVLETKGIVSVIPFRGVVVSEITPKEVEEIFVVREALVQLAVRMATERAGEEDIKILRSMAKKIEETYQEENLVAMVAADNEFHDYIFKMPRNDNLHRVINDLRNRCHIVRYTSWSLPSMLPRIMEEHRLIVDAIEARDAAVACELMTKHISHAKDAYLLRIKTEFATMT